jgi:Tfp pilus assembly protein PilV
VCKKLVALVLIALLLISMSVAADAVSHARTYKHTKSNSTPTTGVSPASSSYQGPPDITCQDTPIYTLKVNSTTIYANKHDSCNLAMTRPYVDLRLWWWNPDTGAWQVLSYGSPDECFGCSEITSQFTVSGLGPDTYRVTAQFTETAPSGYVPAGYVSPTETTYVDLP